MPAAREGQHQDKAAQHEKDDHWRTARHEGGGGGFPQHCEQAGRSWHQGQDEVMEDDDQRKYAAKGIKSGQSACVG
ncbi:hypothetical protein GCM10007276_11070 [Agaricicola taiwanensis]|uniref:Uncharacterized protein n=1 Tax=Agaricicola taiwanensis TaxID=591372 RepID=A0A8J2VNU9_9RHOB|nr:hypothetical protein GCM10007276_11070 [Agaricicola taiwanensis]